VAVVQYTFTHEQYTEYTERNIHNNKKKKFGKCGPCPVFASYTLAFALQLRKKHGKPSVRVVEKCSDIPVAVIQYNPSQRGQKEDQRQVGRMMLKKIYRRYTSLHYTSPHFTALLDDFRHTSIPFI
jgi:hypothetical protein